MVHRKLSLAIAWIFFVLVLLIFWTSVRFERIREVIITPPVPPHVSEDWFFGVENVAQNDADILKYVRANHLLPPKKTSNSPTHPTVTSQFQDILEDLFENITNGFFIECGANDGHFLSNTLYLERSQDWTGLLIESNRFILPALKASNRNAWISDVCLSLEPYPQRVQFLHRVGKEDWYKGNGMIDQGNESFAINNRVRKDYRSAGEVECFPLFSLLAAINVTKVDYFSLDVEGVEYKILKNIPFDKVNIRVISVEANLIPEGASALIDLMKSNGYKEVFNKVEKALHELFFVKDN